MAFEIVQQELNQKLPSPKGLALAIIKACQREEVTAAEVSDLVQTDPALSGRLLMCANAAATGVRPVASVNEAVRRLGLNTVRQLALSFSLIDQHSSGSCREFDYGGFWSHSLLMALAMQEIGRLQRVGTPDDLLTCGLLSQVGRLALATTYPLEYGSVLTQGAKGPQQLQLERDKLQVDHLQLTTALMTHWGIPQSLVEAVSFHEDPLRSKFPSDSRARALCDALHLALKIADYALAPQPTQAELKPGLIALTNAAQLDAEGFMALVERVIVQWQIWGQTLKIQTPKITGFEAVASTATLPPPVLHNMQLRVLVADDDDAARRLLEVLLDSQSDCVVRSARNGQEALELALEFMPHVLVTDWHMPVMDGIDLCQALRSSEWGQGIYILMLTGAGEEDDLVAAFEAGVDDYLVRPVNRRALSARLHGARRYVQMREAWVRDHAQLAQMAAELTLSNKRFKLASHTDPLTEVSNRRAGLLALNQAWSSATRRGSPLAVISIDIDHFKRINDTYGHGVGDAILQYTASTLRKYSRAEDTVCRWGGEEFLVISPDVGQDVAMRTAERLRLAIEHSGIDIPGGSVAITVSLGVACWEVGLQSVESLLSNADAALYEAKGSGRNKTVVHSAEPKDR